MGKKDDDISPLYDSETLLGILRRRGLLWTISRVVSIGKILKENGGLKP